jgi:hypothetical protein
MQSINRCVMARNVLICRIHRRSLQAAGVLLVVWPLTLQAHSPAPAPGCHPPVRPADDQNDFLWQGFLDDVDAFRACISEFAERNNAAAEIHRQAANAATLEWNAFVRSDLNVPEDFPWPPPDGTPSGLPLPAGGE